MVQGVVAMDIDASVMKEYVQNIKLLNTGFVMMVDTDGMDCVITAMTDRVTGWKLIGFISDIENQKKLNGINVG